MLANHAKPFRPLRGGIAVYNPNVGRCGTLGVLARAPNGDPYLVSAYHVLGRRDGAAAADAEPIYQPVDDRPAVAHLDMARCHPGLDLAAARVDGAVGVDWGILALPPLLQPAPAAEGMRVLKSGIATGVTEGVVGSVSADRIRIEPAAGFASTYQLTEGGDSGAVWITDSGAPIGLHIRGNDAGGAEWAEAVPFSIVLSTLGLTLP